MLGWPLPWWFGCACRLASPLLTRTPRSTQPQLPLQRCCCTGRPGGAAVLWRFAATQPVPHPAAAATTAAAAAAAALGFEPRGCGAQPSAAAAKCTPRCYGNCLALNGMQRSGMTSPAFHTHILAQFTRSAQGCTHSDTYTQCNVAFVGRVCAARLGAAAALAQPARIASCIGRRRQALRTGGS